MSHAIARHNGGVSHWYAATALPTRRAPLPGDRSADVCIVGAGFTGLWSAYYLKRARPDLEVVVLEREFAGFGASGRNGGWLTSEFAASREQVARDHGRDAVIALQRAMQGAVDEVIAVAARESIDADIVKRGVLHVARGPVQLQRMHAMLADDRRWGLGPDDMRELSVAELAGRLRVTRASGALFSPHAARVQPAKLVQGLAAAVERLGVTIYEGTTASEVVPGARAVTDRGTVTAPTVLVCLEGFTASLRGRRRDWVPLNSALVATEPLDAATWEQIGWEGSELLGDGAHAYMYAQRTADGRIAFGGRGVPYRFGSRTDVGGRTQQRTIDQLAALLCEFFPVLERATLDHAWCGVLGVPRDWSPTVRFDRASGIGTAGGYVGSGVATSNLAGRTLSGLVLGEASELTALPWVGRSPRRWEPEPLRFIGAHLVYALYRAADRREAAGLRRTSRLADVASRLAGR
ncbi:MAG TPA: FAD-dependent oxidoreductase [Conexibacter sp.]|jgi:glycine/D-amino acid oxidase-like deaminating enzyme